MRRRLIFSVLIVLLPGLFNSVLAFPLKVDIGDIGQTVKSGWEEFSGEGNNETDPKTEIYDVNGLSVSVSVQTGVLNDSGYRDYGGGELGGDMVYPDNHDGPVNGRVILTLSNLPAGDYTLTSYHNDTKDTHTQQDPVNVTVSGDISGSTSALDVVQTKCADDSCLGNSTVTFMANGTGDVIITYTPTTSNGIVSKAVLNGFELDLLGPGIATVRFDSAASSDFEDISPAVLSVILSPATPNTVTVDYNVIGGTAEGGGTDYSLPAGTLIFAPNQATPEYINIDIVDDGVPEDDETIIVLLSNPVNAQLGATGQHTYTILDTNPTVAFDTDASEGRENISPAYIAVSLSWAWDDTVTVDYNVTGGTAAGGEDYSLAAGTLVFEPCDVTENISITIVEDDFDEDPDETIEITLSNPGNAKLGINTQHTFTILPPVARLCPEGDLDGDCAVDFNDLRVFCEQWLDPPGSCSGWDCANIDGVGGVNGYDFAVLAGDWREEVFPVVINEFMASNSSTLYDPCDPNDTPDWIELYNASTVAVDLGGMYLTDDLDDPTEWVIPDGVTIEPGGYLLFIADDDDWQGPMHTSFKLRAEEEDVGLFDRDGSTLLDGIEFRDQVTDISYGRYPDASGNWRFFATPTPEAENVGAYLGEVADTKFSHNRGFYDSAFNLSITCSTGGAEIRYTTDGNKPTESNGTVYTGPIAISSTTCVRAAAFKPGYLPTNVDTQTYIFGADSALKALPTISLVSGELVDRTGAVSMELIYGDPNDGEGFQADCESEAHSSHSYRIKFKAEFGNARLNYPFFEAAPLYADSAVDRFDRLVLRGGNNRPTTWVAEPWTRITQIAMSGPGHGDNSMYMHLYINGSYQGVINPVERPDCWFASSYFGGDFEDYFATNHHELCWRGNHYLSGDPNRYETLLGMAGDENLEDPCNYEVFKALCDVKQFADYTILYWYSGFGDGVDNNYYAFMRNVPLEGSVPPEGLMYFMWDAEYCFTNSGGPSGSETPWVPGYYWTQDGCGDYVPIVRIWRALSENEDFMMLFADRLYKHLFNDGALTDSSGQARWDIIYDHIASGGVTPYLEGSWNGFSGFKDIFMSALYSEGLYPSTDPPSISPYGGCDPTGFSVTMSGSGTIYYTLDGSDPREAVTGNPVGTLYSGPVALTKSAHVKARALNASEWSALNEATFAVGPMTENLRITEIMYHPQDTNDPNDPNTEFIELKNIGLDTLNLNLVSFTDGIDFTFSADINIPAGGYVVVVKDQNAFTSRYPGFPGVIAGKYTGRLNNGGEKIRLEDAIGQTILDFEYRDSWHPITDGEGFSLTIIEPGNGDPNSWGEKDSWRPSAYVNGSPGWDDSGIVPNPGAVVINEVMSHSHLLPDWVELYNTTDGDINIGGWFLSDSDTNVMKYEIAAGTVIETGQYLVFYEDTNFGNPNEPGCNIPFAFSENGEEACLSSGVDGNGLLTGYREVEDFGASESNVSFGRYFKGSTGNYNFVAMDHNTPWVVNAYPKVGPIVINEIMYHPNWPANSLYENEDFEYIELYNITGSDVNLYDEEGNAWKFTDGVEFTFPADTNIPGHGYLVVVRDLMAFTWRYGSMAPGVEVHGPYDGKLSNGGEKLELSMPGDIDLYGTRHYIRIDRVNYSDGSHPEDCPGGVDLWGIEADGVGKSLARIDPNLYGNDPNNWDTDTPSPGSVNP